MKEIKLKEKTITRIDNIDSNIKTLNGQIENILLTILEDNDIDYNKFDVNYENGVIKLTEKKK